MKLIQFILVAIAGIAKAIMDTVQFHFSQCVLKGINDQWFDASVSWKNKYLTWLPDTFTDCWHLSQSFFIEGIFVAIILYKPIVKFNKPNWFNAIIDFLILRGIFGVFFYVFYNYLLIA